MAYPTRAALVAASTVDALTDLDDAVQDGLRAGAIEQIEVYCRQAFTPEADVTKLIDGNDADVLYLPRRLETVDTLTVDGTLIADADFNVAEAGDAIVLVSPVGGSWLTRVRRAPGEPGPAFCFGRSNIAIAGDWGWTACPDAVATAIRFDMEDQALADAHKLADTVRASRTLGVGISQGSMSMTIGTEPGLSARVRRSLVRYRWRLHGVTV